jgi:putative membrane protein
VELGWLRGEDERARRTRTVEVMGNAIDAATDNVRLAYERTTLSWVRTSLTLISFGFTIDKFFEGRAPKTGLRGLVSPQAVGVTMIAFGLIALFLFLFELRRFHGRHPEAPRSTAGYVAGMIAVLGIMALISTLAS